MLNPHAQLTPADAYITGFDYAFVRQCRPWWGNIRPLQEAQLYPLILSGAYRPKWLVVPPYNGLVIPARSNYHYETKVPAGSWVIGITLWGGTGWGVQVWDTCSQIPFYDRPAGGEIVDRSIANTEAPGPNLLTAPRLILEPGGLAVELLNGLATDQNLVQLVISYMEPCGTDPRDGAVIGARRNALTTGGTVAGASVQAGAGEGTGGQSQ